MMSQKETKSAAFSSDILSSMRITVNGEPREVGAKTSLLSLLTELGVDPRRSAAALNTTAVPRGELGEKELAAGDVIEIIEAVGGG